MKIIVMGQSDHGKNTVCEMLERHGYTWASSSEFMCENVVYPALKEKYNYESPEQCHADRHNHQPEWYQLIADFNTPDKASLAKAIYAEHDICCGLRHIEEFNASKATGLFDYAIWVDASDRKPSEDESSCTVTKELADFVIDNNGTLEDLERTVTHSIRRLEFEFDRAQFDSRMSESNSLTKGPGFTIFWDDGEFPARAKPVDVIDAVIHRLNATQPNDDVVDYLRAASLTIKSEVNSSSLRVVG